MVFCFFFLLLQADYSLQPQCLVLLLPSFPFSSSQIFCSEYSHIFTLFVQIQLFGGIFFYPHNFKWGRNWIIFHAPYCFQSSSKGISGDFGDLPLWWFSYVEGRYFPWINVLIGEMYLPEKEVVLDIALSLSHSSITWTQLREEDIQRH